jgi:hypothetical protein
MEMNNLNVTATYTFFRSEFTDISGTYRPSSWDSKHLVNLIASYKLPKNWNIAMRWRFIGGAPYTPIDEVKSSLKSAWDITNQPYLDYSQYNAKRLKSSHQLDIRIDKEFYFKKWVLNLYTDIQNAYIFKSESAPIYTIKNTEGVVVSKDANNYQLRQLDDNFSGTILPTIGIIIKI